MISSGGDPGLPVRAPGRRANANRAPRASAARLAGAALLRLAARGLGWCALIVSFPFDFGARALLALEARVRGPPA